MGIKDRIKSVKILRENVVKTKRAFSALTNNIKMIFFNVFSGHLKVENNKIVACSFYGKGYRGNVKKVLETLIKEDGIDVVLVLDKKHMEENIPEGIRKVRYGTFCHLRELATARVWLDDSRKKFLPKKKKSQCYVQLWHGFIAVKKFEFDTVMPKKYRKWAELDNKNIDLIVSGNNIRTFQFRRALRYDREILEVGTPMLDDLVNIREDAVKIASVKENMANLFGYPSDSRVAMYAPTFRDNPDFDYGLDYGRVISALEDRFGGRWVMLTCFHPNLSVIYDNYNFNNENVINVTRYSNIFEIMPAVDLMLTDYSSIMFEYSILRRPVLLFANDFDEYTNKERGLYFDLEKLPFPVSKTNDELVECIKKIDINSYERKLDNFTKKIVKSYEKGNASKIVAKKIMEVIGGKKK